MAKPRKQGNKSTTISIPWEVKNRIRSFAEHTKKTTVGQNWENDDLILRKVLNYYAKDHKITNPELYGTYPTKVNV